MSVIKPGRVTVFNIKTKEERVLHAIDAKELIDKFPAIWRAMPNKSAEEQSKEAKPFPPAIDADDDENFDATAISVTEPVALDIAKDKEELEEEKKAAKPKRSRRTRKSSK